jgi:hypothetical protein
MRGLEVRTFEPDSKVDTQNVAMDGTAKTLTFARPSDLNSSVYLVNSGTVVIFVRLDGTTPTSSNAIPLLANTAQTMSMPTGSTTVKVIGAAGSTLYATMGRGL